MTDEIVLFYLRSEKKVPLFSSHRQPLENIKNILLLGNNRCLNAKIISYLDISCVEKMTAGKKIPEVENEFMVSAYLKGSK